MDNANSYLTEATHPAPEPIAQAGTVASNEPTSQPPERPGIPELLKAAEVCRMLRVSQRTLHRWRQTGGLPAVMIGGSVRYIADDVRALIAGRLTGSIMAKLPPDQTHQASRRGIS